MLRHARLRRAAAAGTAPAKTLPVTSPGIAPHGVARAHYRELAATEGPPAPGPAPTAEARPPRPAAGPPRPAAGSAEPVASPGQLPVRKRQPAHEAPSRDEDPAANAAPGHDEPGSDDPATDGAALPPYWRMVGRAKHPAQPAGVTPPGASPPDASPPGTSPPGTSPPDTSPPDVPAARTPPAGPPPVPPGSEPGTVPTDQLSQAPTPGARAGSPLPDQAGPAGDPIGPDAAQDSAPRAAFDRMRSSPTPPGS
jgi:hypothetical protein